MDKINDINRINKLREIGKISSENKNPSPLKQIGKYCYECSGNSYRERLMCTVKNCPLYVFRLGKNPYKSDKTYKKLMDIEDISGKS